MAKKVRDTLYGYTYLTKIEEAVSQHPLVLRMHYIHQTSFTFLTYPNAHSTRYPHSLGVMHVAGEVFLSAVSNSRPQDLNHVSTVVRLFLASRDISLDDLSLEFTRAQDDAGREPFYESAKWGTGQRGADGLASSRTTLDGTAGLPIILLLQAVRLAALLHDIGHPPFSHIVEYGLLQACGESYPGHEEVGFRLVRILQDDPGITGRSGFSQRPLFAKSAMILCREILEADDLSNFYGLKKSLLSGPVDADRLDYVRRDAHSAGMVPSYDIRRLVDAAFFRKRQDQRFEIAFRPNCLSSFEDFFFARYDIYRYMIYHHDAVRRNLCVQRLIVALLTRGKELSPAIRALAEDLRKHALGQAKKGFGSYDRFVDAYFVNLLWSLDDLLPDEDRELITTGDHIKFYLDLVLRRRNDKLRTLIKRADEYTRFADEVLSYHGAPKAAEGESKVTLFNSLLRARLREIQSNLARKDENVAKFELAHEIETSINRVAARNSKAKFFSYYIGTFGAGPQRKVAFSAPGHEAQIIAENVSPTITMLEGAWNFSPHLLLFFHIPGGGAGIEESDPRDIMWPAAVEGVRQFLLKS